MQQAERDALQNQIRTELEELYGRQFSLLRRLEEFQEQLFDTLGATLSEADLADPHVGRHCFIALAVKTMKTVRVVHLLAREGYAEDALSLARSALSSAAALSHIARDVEQHGHDYLDWALFAKYDRLRKRVKAGDATQAELDAQLAKLDDHERSIIERFRADGRRTWSGLSDRTLAERASLASAYELIYPHASSTLHGSVEGLASFLDEYRRFGQMTLGPSTNESRLVLSVTIGAALVVLDRIIAVFGLDRSAWQALMDDAQTLLLSDRPAPEETEVVRWDYGLRHPTGLSGT